MMSMMTRAMVSAMLVLMALTINVSETAAEVRFRVVDPSGFGLSSNEDQIYVQLTRLTTSATETVAACWLNEGCTDNYGYGTINAMRPWNQTTLTYDAVPLPAGRYDLAIAGPGRQVARRTFNYDGYFLDLNEIVLHATASKITLKSDYLQSVPNSGGSFSVEFDIAHNTNIDKPFNAMVRVVISTPGINAFTNFYGINNQPITLEPNSSVLYSSGQINIPANVPDGSWTCVNLSVTRRDNPADVYGIASACAVKGMNMAFLPSQTY